MNLFRFAFLSLIVVASFASAATPAPKPLPPGVVQVSVENLHCATCAKKVARKLYALQGVKKVSTSLKQNLVTVYLPANKEAPITKLWNAIASADQKPVELRVGSERLNAEEMAPLIAAAVANSTSR